MSRAGLDRLANARVSRCIARAHQLMGAILHPPCHVGVGRAACGGLYLKAARPPAVVRGRDDDAVARCSLWRGLNEESPAVTGVGVTPFVGLDDGSTLLAASTSAQCHCAVWTRRVCPCPCTTGRQYPDCAGNHRWPV